MSLPMQISITLAAIAAIAMIRVAITSGRRGDRLWRRALLVLGQAALAGLVFWVLLPPTQPGSNGALVLLTPGADTTTLELGPGDRVLALPEAAAFDGAQPVPDLGTALRRHPGATAVRVLGAGLDARDRDAAQGLAFSFEAAPLPATLVELTLPDTITRGRRFELHGRIERHADGSVELLDPAGERLDLHALDESGRFRLTGTAGPAGTAVYRLQWRRAEADVADELSLALPVSEGAPLRVLAIAGGASPELKYLRRWALDAGLVLGTQMRLGGGIVLGDDRRPLTAANLAELDLVVLDERAWRALGAGGQATLRDAVRDGLGLLLRLTADPSAAERDALADWGFELTPADMPRGLRLPDTARADAATPGNDDAEARATDAAPLLSRRALQLAAADGRTLVRSDAGDTVALWRTEGRGRVALWTLSDSFRLSLAGRQSAYGSLWSNAFGTLARARGEITLPTPQAAWVGERSALCGLTDASRLLDPDAEPIPLVRDPATGERGCAAFWPAQEGWHRLQQDGSQRAFLVRSPATAPGLHAASVRAATLALAGQTVATLSVEAPEVPGPRWPWVLAWLVLAASLWWLERSRRGRG
ncbi:carboxypeptidase regulatory-like domain-containing protein [Arenimonas alkanexedens]